MIRARLVSSISCLLLSAPLSGCGEEASQDMTGASPSSSLTSGAMTGSGTGGSVGQGGGETVNSGAPGTGGQTQPAGVGQGVAGANGTAGTNNTGNAGGSAGINTMNGAAGMTGSANAAAGASGGSGGMMNTGGNTDMQGMGAAGTPGSAGTENAGGSGGQAMGGQSGLGGAGGEANAGGMGGSGTAMGGDPCPADATFCSGFESDELPEGAVFKFFGDPATPWTTLFEIDSTVQHSGASSLRVRKNSEPNANTQYKMLAVPAPGPSFWVRMYVQSDIELGQEGHNAYAAASENDDPNDGSRVEFADDVGLAFNASDDVRWPDGYGRLMSGGTNPYTLPADQWHCIELSFDGMGRVQAAYVEGEQLISAMDYPGSAMNFGVFKFGYWGFHNEADRGVWFDDVAVGPTRIGCL